MPRLRAVLCAAVLACALVVPAGPALAHAYPTSARPAENSRLAAPPPKVVILFTERLEPHFTRLEVLDAQGKRVDKGDVRVGPRNGRRLSVDLPKLVPGTYRVVWHATSVDAHQTKGSYLFTVLP